MINETRVVENKYSCECGSCYRFHRKCLSWSAVLAGAIIAFVIGFILNLFGVSIGLAAFTNTQTGVQTLAIGGFIALIIFTIASMYMGGMVSGYLGRAYCEKRNLGILYGGLAFGVALFLGIFFTMPMANFVTKYNNDLYGRSDNAPIAVIANPMSDTSTVVSKSDIDTNRAAMNKNNSRAALKTERTANDLGKAAFLTFVLFTIGLLSACIGGHHGMTCKCRYDDSVCLKDKR